MKAHADPNCTFFRGLIAVQQGFLTLKVQCLCAPSLVRGILAVKMMSNTHIAERRLRHHQGPFDKLTLRQPGGDNVARSSRHGVRSATCYTAVSLPGALVHHCGVTFHRDNAAAEPARTKVPLWEANWTCCLGTFKRQKAHQWSSDSLFDCPNQRVEPCVSLAFICCPCRFTLPTRRLFSVFDWPLLGNQCHADDDDDDDGRTSLSQLQIFWSSFCWKWMCPEWQSSVSALF